MQGDPQKKPSHEILTERVQQLEHDVAEHRAAEQALRESEIQYRLLAETATEMIILCDSELRIRYINSAVTTLSGHRKEDILGRGIDDFLEQDAFLRARRNLEEARRTLDTCTLCETVFRHQDGHLMPIEVNSTPIIKQGAWEGFLFTARDISERKRMNEELLRAKKLESIGVLAGGIAHDYNNLLTAILGYVTLAESYLNPNHEAAPFLGRARKATDMAKELSKKLVTFSKGGKPVRKPGSIRPLLENTVDFALAGSNVRCEHRIPSDIWMVAYDESQMSQVVHNIAVNAREAMPQGGTLRVKTENVSARKRSSHPVDEGNWVHISIEDEGTGIPEQHLDKIFDPYFTTKEMGPKKGLGLGLAICHSVIQNHAGYIFAESGPGRGTAFHIYLPATSTPSGKAPSLRKDTLSCLR